MVDAADYTVWRDSLGQSGSGLAADGDGNRIIDAADYVLWKTNFGQTAGSGSAAIILAPEPSTMLLWSALVLSAGLLPPLGRPPRLRPNEPAGRGEIRIVSNCSCVSNPRNFCLGAGHCGGGGYHWGLT